MKYFECDRRLLGMFSGLPSAVSSRSVSLCTVLICSLLIGPCEAVEITDTKAYFGPFEGGGGASAWSPNGKRIMITESNEGDARIQLCVYTVETRVREGCIYYIQYEPGLGVHAIDWSEEYIYAEVGFDDGSVIVKLPAPEFEPSKVQFRESDIGNFKAIPDSYGYPEWDEWSQSLFFMGEDETQGIKVVGKDDAHPRPYVSGAYPALTKQFVWFTLIDKRTLRIRGISRMRKTSKNMSVLTNPTGYADVYVSPRLDEKAALFIRTKDGSNETELFSYVEAEGVMGPLHIVGRSPDEVLDGIRLAPSGNEALITTRFLDKRDEARVMKSVRLVKLQW